MSVITLGNTTSNYSDLSSNSSAALYNLFDYLLPTYFENTERNNVNNPGGSHWVVEEINPTDGYIVVDKALPIDMIDCGIGLQNQWFVYRYDSSWMQVTSVDLGKRRIYYGLSKGGAITNGVEVYLLCPFRSAFPNPLSLIIDVQSWANLWIIPGSSWVHSDGTYRMVGIGYTTGASPNHNTLTLFSSSDLSTWTVVGGNYKYKAGVHPFDKEWCVDDVILQMYGNPVKITGGTYDGYYANLVGGRDENDFYKIAVVIFDEDFNIVYMPESAVTIPGYIVDSSYKYTVGLGLFYRDSKLYATISYRDLFVIPNVYKILLCELSDVVNPSVLSVKEVVSGVVPNSWISLSAPGGPALLYKNKLYFFLVGESQGGYTQYTPLNANFECGVVYEWGDGYRIHKQSPFILNAINCEDVFPWSYEMMDALGTFGSHLRVGDTLNMFIAAKFGTNGYRIWRYVLNLPE